MSELEEVRKHQEAKALRIFLTCQNREMDLDEIATAIAGGSGNCVRSLIDTIYATMDARKLQKHREYAKRLYEKCFILSGLLCRKVYPHRVALGDAFEDLKVYAKGGLFH